MAPKPNAVTRMMVIAMVCMSSAIGTATAQPQVAAEFRGSYVCIQGQTDADLRVYRQPAGRLSAAVFTFGPTSTNPTVPSGNFSMTGRADLTGGIIALWQTSGSTNRTATT